MNPIQEMKAELPQRLREYATMTSPASPHRVTLEHAADEIERLRRLCDNMLSHLNGISRTTAEMVRANSPE